MVLRRTYWVMFSLLLFSCGESAKNTHQKKSNSSIAVDSTVLGSDALDSIISPYRGALLDEMNTVIGFASKTLLNEEKIGESTLGNFASDLILYQSRKRFSDTVHLALINAHGGLRTPISEGEITVGSIFELMPFDNEMVVLSLSGKTIMSVFNHTAKDPKNSISPSRFTIKNNVAEDVLIAGNPIDSSAIYNLAISDYLANGGGGFHFLIPFEQRSLNIKLRDMIIEHIKELSEKNKEVGAVLDGRILIEKDVQ